VWPFRYLMAHSGCLQTKQLLGSMIAPSHKVPRPNMHDFDNGPSTAWRLNSENLTPFHISVLTRTVQISDLGEELRRLLAAHNAALGGAATVHSFRAARITMSVAGIDASSGCVCCCPAAPKSCYAVMSLLNCMHRVCPADGPVPCASCWALQNRHPHHVLSCRLTLESITPRFW
jgi:hypothetical protein